jgi:hypothetical protein
MTVCKHIDDFILDKDKTYWIATLSDGTVVYEDDGRPDLERVSWFRLRNYCKENSLSIVKMAMRFRSNYVECFVPADGVFFRRSCLGSFGLKASDGSVKSLEFYLIGNVLGNNIHVQRWHVPELIMSDEQELEPRPVEGNEESIIWNYAQQSPVEQQTPHTT